MVLFILNKNENYRLVVILNLDVRHNMLPDFYDLSKEGNENRDISGDQNASVLQSY